MFGRSVVTYVGEIYCRLCFDVFLTWLQRGTIRKHHLFVYVSFHFKKGFLNGFHKSRGCPTLSKPKISLFLALKHWGSGRCLTRWSRTCNIPIRPNGEKFSRVLCGVYLTETKLMLEQEMETKPWKETHAPWLLGFRTSLVLMCQALAKAFDIKKAQHQRNQMLKHPGTCWWKKSQTTTWYLWNPMKKWDILHINWWSPDSFQQTFFEVILKEEELQEDPAKSEAQNIMRYGRHQILPSFWNLLVWHPRKWWWQVAGSGRCTSVV